MALKVKTFVLNAYHPFDFTMIKLKIRCNFSFTKTLIVLVFVNWLNVWKGRTFFVNFRVG